MTLSSIIFGLIVTFLSFCIVHLYKKIKLVVAMYNKVLKESKQLASLMDKEITSLITQKLDLEEQVDHLKSTVTNLRRAERKHVATIKKLAGK